MFELCTIFKHAHIEYVNLDKYAFMSLLNPRQVEILTDFFKCEKNWPITS